MFINPSVHDRFICVGARCRQFGEFRALRRNRTRLRDRKISWIVSKGRATVFLSYIAAGTSVKYYVLSRIRADCARLKDHRIMKRVLLKLQFMIKERRLNILTPFSRLYDLAVSRNLLSKSS